MGIFNKTIPEAAGSLNGRSKSVKLLKLYLCESLKLRILNVPVPPGLDQEHNVRIAVLFSGGLDCTVLARMAHDLLPLGDHIDLINVAFENPRVIQAARNPPKSKKHGSTNNNTESSSGIQERNTDQPASSAASPFELCPDRETGWKAFKELKETCPDRVWRFVAVGLLSPTYYLTGLILL